MGFLQYFGMRFSRAGLTARSRRGRRFCGLQEVITQLQSDLRARKGQEYALGWGRTGGEALRCSWWLAPLGICTIFTLPS